MCFSQVEDLSITSVPILVFPWDQQGLESAAAFSPCPIYPLSLYKICNKWFSLNFFPFHFFFYVFSRVQTGAYCIFWMGLHYLSSYLAFSPHNVKQCGSGVLVILYTQAGISRRVLARLCRQFMAFGIWRKLSTLVRIRCAAALTLSPDSSSPLPGVAGVLRSTLHAHSPLPMYWAGRATVSFVFFPP